MAAHLAQKVSSGSRPDGAGDRAVFARRGSGIQVAESGRAGGRAELLANFFGGAVWGNFRENANCGDPPGTLPGNLPGNLRGNLPVPCTFRRCLLAKIRQKFGKIWATSSENLSNLAKFGEKISKMFSDF